MLPTKLCGGCSKHPGVCLVTRMPSMGAFAGVAPGEAARAAQQAAAEHAGLEGLRARGGYAESVLRTMRLLDPGKLNYELAAQALRWVAAQRDGGAVLVFMPGVLAALAPGDIDDYAALFLCCQHGNSCASLQWLCIQEYIFH